MGKKLFDKVLTRNSAFNFVYNILNLLFPLITSMYVSRILYPEGVGKVAYAQNLTSYFITFATLGLPTYGVREIAKSRTLDQEKNRVFTELFVINAISTTLAVATFLVFVLSPSMQNDRYLLLCCGVQLFFNFLNIDWLYQGMEEYGYIVCRSIAIKLASLLCIFLFVRTQDDYAGYALLSSVALAGNHVLNIFQAKKYVLLDFRGIRLKKHMRPLMILGAAVFFSTVYSKLDITMLGLMHSERETGLYSNAFRLVAIAGSVSSSISAVFLPRLSFYYQNDKDEFMRLLRYGIRVISFFAFPIVAGLVVLCPHAVSLLYGDCFLPAVPTIRILSLLVLIKSFGDLLCYQLSIAAGHEKDRLFAYFLAAILNVGLNYMLIPVLGRNGAALASVLSELLLNAVQFIKMKKIIGYRIPGLPLLQGILATGVMTLVMLGLLKIPAGNLTQFLLAGTTGVLSYVLVNWLMRNELLFSFLKRVRK